MNTREEGGVLSIRVTVNSTDSCDAWVELVILLFTKVRAYCEVEGFLDRPAGVSGILENIPTDVFRKTSIRLVPERRYENPRGFLDR